MANERIRAAAKDRRVMLWQIADRIGVSEFTLVRWLRHELPEDKKQKILEAINAIENERGANHASAEIKPRG